MYILVVDDDVFANTLVQFVLAKEGFDVKTTDNPWGAMRLIEDQEPDLLILDVCMPHLNGFEFSQKLYKEGYEIPLIFMTIQGTIEAKLQGFDVGADDYICKPYNHQELVARVKAVMHRIKRSQAFVKQNVCVGRIELVPVDLKLIIDGNKSITLTPTEVKMLHILMSSSGQTINRDQLMVEVWDDDDTSSNIVDVYIRRLRTKLEEDPNRPHHIISVRGIGYKFI